MSKNDKRDKPGFVGGKYNTYVHSLFCNNHRREIS